MGVLHRPVLAAEQPQDRLRPDIVPFLDPVRLPHRRVPADPGQFRRDGGDRAALDRRRGREPGCQFLRHPGFGDADLPGVRVQEQRRREGQQRQPHARIVVRGDPLPAGPVHLPGEFAAPRRRPRKRHAADVVGPRAPGLDNSAHQRDKLVALRPVVAQGPDAPPVAEPELHRRNRPEFPCRPVGRAVSAGPAAVKRRWNCAGAIGVGVT